MEIFSAPKQISTQIKKALSDLTNEARVEKTTGRYATPDEKAARAAAGGLDMRETGRRLEAALKVLGREDALEGMDKLENAPSTRVLSHATYLAKEIKKRVGEVVDQARWRVAVYDDALSDILGVCEEARILTSKAADKTRTLQVCEAKQRLENALKVLRGEEVSTNPAQSSAVTRFERFGGDPAIVGTVTVNEASYEAILSEALIGKDRGTVEKFARSVGGRLATRDENLFFARNLVEQAKDGTLNEAGRKALEIYQARHVRDEERKASVFICKGEATDYYPVSASGNAPTAALIVRAPLEGK